MWMLCSIIFMIGAVVLFDCARAESIRWAKVCDRLGTEPLPSGIRLPKTTLVVPFLYAWSAVCAVLAVIYAVWME